MREIKVRYTCRRGNGHIFSRIFTLEQIESCYLRQWWELNYISGSELYKDQYTGLLDKNGVEIYAGDIYEEMSWIGWCDKCASFELFFVDFCCASCSGDVRWWEVVEEIPHRTILGNIYQNPELLGKETECTN